MTDRVSIKVGGTVFTGAPEILYVPPVEVPRFYFVAAGDYETVDGQILLYQHVGVHPAAWTIESKDGSYVYVNGAGSKRDALALFADEWKRLRS